MSTPPTRTSRAQMISALLAGFIAGFIWMAITVLVGEYTDAAIVGGGIAFVVLTAVATFVIASAVSSSKAKG